MYSSSKEVLDRLSATLLGLEKAKAVPRGDWESAPMSKRGRERKKRNNNKTVYLRCKEEEIPPENFGPLACQKSNEYFSFLNIN